MAFDINNPLDLSKLKDEVEIDPAGVGYEFADSTDDLLQLLNSSTANPGFETGVPPLVAAALWEMIATENLASGSQFVTSLLYAMTADSASDLSYARLEMSGLDPGLAAKIAAQTFDFSRADVLFSDTDVFGTNEMITITRDDWIAARNS